ADLVRGVKALRDVVLTNGPMLRIAFGGAPGTATIGGVARGHVVTVQVHVESAPWVVVDALRLVRASDAVSAKPEEQPVTEALNAAGALAADATFTVRAATDDAFVILASGKTPMTPVLAADPASVADITPWAMTGAVWIDADGDGRALGRVAAPASVRAPVRAPAPVPARAPAPAHARAPGR
ncbi:MAG TPA: hypothetical protein VIJ48_02935, partial [Acidimicrobiia bacterium]